MSKKILLRKTYSVYASNMHLATMIFPFINNEIEKGAIIKPILEKGISENISKVIKNVGINPDLKKQINNIDWKKTSIEKIKQTLNDIEVLLKESNRIHIIVLGTNEFIDKVNELIDIWAKVNLENVSKKDSVINIINCYSFEDNKDIINISNKHQFLLKTAGIEEILFRNKLKKAN